MQIVSKISLNLNRTTAHSCRIVARQGEKNGRVIEATLLTDIDVFTVPDTFNATGDGIIDDVLVAQDIPCEVKNGKVYIPLTELMCAASGDLRLVVKLIEDDAVVYCPEIIVEVAQEFIDDGVDNLYAEINEYKDAIEETAEALRNKGIDIPDDFVPSDIPQVVGCINTTQAVVLNEYGQITEIVFPDNITEIAPYAYVGQTGLTKVTFPSTLKGIQYSAFSNTSIVEVDIPHGCTALDMSVFAGCNALKTIKLPNTLRSMSANTFSEVFPDSIELEDGFGGDLYGGITAFRDMDNLTVDTVVSMFEAVADKTGQDVGVFYLNPTVYLKLSSEQKAIVQNKNWIIETLPVV